MYLLGCFLFYVAKQEAQHLKEHTGNRSRDRSG